MSPDGTRIAYVDQGGVAIHVMDFNGLNDQLVYAFPAGDTTSGIDWSPDSKQLIFDTYPSGGGCCDAQTTSFHELNADGSNLRDMGSGYQPLWSPDGQKILFEDLSTYDWALANTDGSNRQEFAQDTSEWLPSWQALP